jgi:hypothetical protein
MYAIVVDYFCWSKEKGEYTTPLYLGIAFPPKNLYVFDEEHNSRSFRWENKADAEKYFKEHGFDSPACCYNNARIEEVEICTK